MLFIATVFGMQVHSVRETNRLLDGKLQQLQSQLHEQAASTKQARVRIHMAEAYIYSSCCW